MKIILLFLIMVLIVCMFLYLGTLDIVFSEAVDLLASRTEFSAYQDGFGRGETSCLDYAAKILKQEYFKNNSP